MNSQQNVKVVLLVRTLIKENHVDLVYKTDVIIVTVIQTDVLNRLVTGNQIRLQVFPYAWVGFHMNNASHAPSLSIQFQRTSTMILEVDVNYAANKSEIVTHANAQGIPVDQTVIQASQLVHHAIMDSF